MDGWLILLAPLVADIALSLLLDHRPSARKGLTSRDRRAW